MADALKRLMEMLPADKAADLEERADLVRHKLKFINENPIVASICSIQPIKISAGWIADAITVAGGNPLFENLAEPGWEQLSSADIVIMALDGLSLEQSLLHLTTWLQIPGFMEMKAVKNNQLYIADAAKYFDNAPSALIDTVEMLAEIINPKQFIFGFEGAGWAKFSL